MLWALSEIRGGGVFQIFPQWYYDIFLATRNGLFFTPIFIVVGALLHENKTSFKSQFILLTIAAIGGFVVEVTFIRSQLVVGTDTSMYFTMPLLLFTVMSWATRDNQVSKKCGKRLKQARKLSVLIYCLQYICFTTIDYLLKGSIVGPMFVIINYLVLLWASAIALFIIQKSRIRWIGRLI